MRTRTAQGRRSVWFRVVEPGTAIALGGFASQLSGLAFLHLFSVCRVGFRLASPGACNQAVERSRCRQACLRCIGRELRES